MHIFIDDDEKNGGVCFVCYSFFATESQKQCFSRRQAMSKTVLFDLVFLTPRQKVSFGPRTQNDDFLGTRPRAAPLGSCQKNSSFFVLGTKLLFFFSALLLHL